MGGIGSGNLNWRKNLTHSPRGHEYTAENSYPNPKGYKQCRACRKLRADSFRATAEGKECRRWHRFKTLYGLTKEQIERQLEAQSYLCAMCNRPFTPRKEGTEGNGTAWVVDHDHLTEKFRGLVHQNCNLAIGYLEDNPELCRLAAAYLERNEK